MTHTKENSSYFYVQGEQKTIYLKSLDNLLAQFEKDYSGVKPFEWAIWENSFRLVIPFLDYSATLSVRPTISVEKRTGFPSFVGVEEVLTRKNHPPSEISETNKIADSKRRLVAESRELLYSGLPVPSKEALLKLLLHYEKLLQAKMPRYGQNAVVPHQNSLMVMGAKYSHRENLPHYWWIQLDSSIPASKDKDGRLSLPKELECEVNTACGYYPPITWQYLKNVFGSGVRSYQSVRLERVYTSVTVGNMQNGDPNGTIAKIMPTSNFSDGVLMVSDLKFHQAPEITEELVKFYASDMQSVATLNRARPKELILSWMEGNRNV